MPSMDARNFAISLKNFGDLTEEKMTTICRKITLKLDERVVFLSPVLTGRFRGNWHAELNDKPNYYDWEHYDAVGTGTFAKITATVEGMKVGQIAWLTNNLPYAIPLENGWSKKAPDGMVSVALWEMVAHYGGTVEHR